MRDMRELINLIEGAQDTQEPIVEEASEWQWQKLYEYNLKATLQNFAPKMIEQGLTKIFSSASTKGLFTEHPGQQTKIRPNSEMGDNEYLQLAYKLIQKEVHKRYKAHEQAGLVKRFLDSDSLSAVAPALDAFQGGYDRKDNERYDSEKQDYVPDPEFSFDKQGDIDKFTYNTRYQTAYGVPGSTGYLDPQPFGTFANAGLGKGIPIYMYGGDPRDGEDGSFSRNLPGYTTEKNRHEVGPIYREIMQDQAFQRKFGETFLRLLESFDPTPQKKYVLGILKYFLRQEFNAEITSTELFPDVGSRSPTHRTQVKGKKQQYRKIYSPWKRGGRQTSFPSIEDMRSTFMEVLMWFDENKHRMPVEQRDFNNYGTINDFEWKNFQKKQAQEQDEIDNPKLDKQKGSFDKIYSSQHADVYWIKDEEGSCYVGQGTRWCTAATRSSNYFSQYNSKGPLLVINFSKPTLFSTNKILWSGVDTQNDMYDDSPMSGDIDFHTKKVNRVQMNLLYGEGYGRVKQSMSGSMHDGPNPQDATKGIHRPGQIFDPKTYEDRFFKIPYGTEIKSVRDIVGVGREDYELQKRYRDKSYYDKFMYIADPNDQEVYPIISNSLTQQRGLDLSNEPFTLMWNDPKFQTAMKKVMQDWQEINQHPLVKREETNPYNYDSSMELNREYEDYLNEYEPDWDEEWED